MAWCRTIRIFPGQVLPGNAKPVSIPGNPMPTDHSPKNQPRRLFRFRRSLRPAWRLRRWLAPMAVIAAGLAAGAALKRGFGPTDGAGSSGDTLPGLGPRSDDGSGADSPFSLEKFHSAQGLEMHRMLAQVLPGADADLVRSLADDLENREAPQADSPVWKALMARWVRLHAPEALDWARAADGRAAAKSADEVPSAAELEMRRWSSDGFGLLALRAWTAADATAAIGIMRRENLRENRAVLGVLADLDPARALLLAGDLEKAGHSVQILEFVSNCDMLLPKWAARDPLAALAWVMSAATSGPGISKSQKPEDVREEMLRAVAQGWAEKDALGCAAWIATLEPPLRSLMLDGVRAAIGTNPAGVAEILSVQPMVGEGLSAGLELAGKWAETDPHKALDWARSRFPEGDQRALALSRIAASVMGTDLRAAVAIMDEAGWQADQEPTPGDVVTVIPGTDGGPDQINDWSRGERSGAGFTIRQLLSRLSVEDPALAVRCFEKVDPELQPRLLGDLVPGWYQQQPEAALNWLASLPATRVSGAAMEGLIGDLNGLTPESMRDLALRLPAGPLSEALAAKSMEETVVTDPQSALDNLPFTDPASRRAAVGEIVRQWAETEPRQALDRLLAEPGPPVAAFSGVVEKWTNRDPETASSWAAALPPGEARDAAIGGMISALTNSSRNPDMPAALLWSLELSDSGNRLETLRSLMMDEPTTDAEAQEIHKILQQTPALSDSERQSLLRLLKP